MSFNIDQTLLENVRTLLSGRASIYWLVGGAGSGKTIVSNKLSQDFGLSVYEMDAHIYGDYHARFNPKIHPVNTAWAAAPNGLDWLLSMSWDDYLNLR